MSHSLGDGQLNMNWSFWFPVILLSLPHSITPPFSFSLFFLHFSLYFYSFSSLPRSFAPHFFSLLPPLCIWISKYTISIKFCMRSYPCVEMPLLKQFLLFFDLYINGILMSMSIQHLFTVLRIPSLCEFIKSMLFIVSDWTFE